MQEDNARVLIRCFGSIAIGALAGFALPVVLFYAIFHNASGGGVFRPALMSICMPTGAIIGLARALKIWRAHVAVPRS